MKHSTAFLLPVFCIVFASAALAEVTMTDIWRWGLLRKPDIEPLKTDVSTLVTNRPPRIYDPAGQPAWIDGAGGVWRICTVTNWVVTFPQNFGYYDEGDVYPPPAASYTVHAANGGTGAFSWTVSDGNWEIGITQVTAPYVSFYVHYLYDYGVWEKVYNGIYEYQVTAPVIADDTNENQNYVGFPVFSRSVSIVTSRVDNVALLSSVSNIIQSAINAHIQALHP